MLLGSYGISALSQLVEEGVPGLVVAYVATAAGPDAESKFWVQADRLQLESLGCRPLTLDLAAADEAGLGRRLGDVDAVFVTGGSTYLLLWHARRSGFAALVPRLVEAGELVYVGTSAGAILAGPDIDPAAHPDGRAYAPPLESTQGLALVGFSVLPHEDHADRKAVNDAVAVAHPDRNFIRLRDDQAVVVRGESSTVVDSPLAL
jgi:dipeptidase E